MIPAISQQSTQSVATKHLLETSQKRKIIAEFQEIGKTLSKSPLHDEMTEIVRREHARFTAILDKTRKDDIVIKCFDTFITVLQGHLRDPIFRKPLDKDALLGSDGRTYGKKSLSIYLASVAAEHRHRSPLNPNNNASCYYAPHSVIQHIIQFLEKHGKLLTSPDLETGYQQLVRDNALPEIPTEDSEQIRLFLAQQAERESKKNARMQECKSNMQSAMQAKLQEKFAALRIQKDKDKQDIDNRLAELEKRKKIMESLTQEAKQLHTEIELLAQKIQQLDESVQELHRDVDAAKKEYVQLEVAYHQAMKALKEREAGWVKSLLEAAGWITVAYVANQILPGSFILKP